MSKILGRAGFYVRSVASSAQALIAARSYHFDVLVTELQLVDGDGVDLLAHIRSHFAVKAVTFTGRGMPADRVRSGYGGFDRHLLKPGDLSRIAHVIRELT